MHEINNRQQKMFIFFCLCLILANMILFGASFHKGGWDFRVYYGAAKAFEEGKNPYLVNDLKIYSKNRFCFNYPPLSIVFFRTLCRLNHFTDMRINSYILFSILLIGTFLVVKRADSNFRPLFLATLLTTGFMAAERNFITGNIELVNLFLFSIMFYWIIKKKYYIASAFLVLASILKITPLIFGSIFFFFDMPRRDKIGIFLFILIFFILIHVFSYVLFPDISKSYYLQLLGKLGNQNTPLREYDGRNNSAPFFLLKDISHKLFGNNFASLYIVLIGFVLAIFIYYVSIKKRQFLHIFSFGILALMLSLPRLKAYSFVWALLPIYFLVKDSNLTTRCLTLTIVSALPLLFYAALETLTSYSIVFSPRGVEVSVFLFIFVTAFLILDYFFV